MLKFNINKTTEKQIDDIKWDEYLEKINQENVKLHNKTGEGSEFTGWLDLPSRLIKENNWYHEAIDMFKDMEAVVCIGIGGSYLGTRAVLEAVHPPYSKSKPEIIFAGHHLDSAYHQSVLEYLKNKKFGIIVISKSGTTTEPAVAFRMFLDLLKEQGNTENLKNHIIAITDANKGALRKLSDELSLPSYVVPDDVGGRYSVLTPVGMLPLAVAGINIQSLAEGAAEMENISSYRQLPGNNPSVQYAAFRKLMWDKGKSTEILANTQPSFSYIAEWWKQLFGESEGKDNKALFPANIDLTSDLHSLGQFIQEGHQIFFETFLKISKQENIPIIPKDKNNYDQLNYLAGKPMSFVNKQAAEGTIQAHSDAGVPIAQISLEAKDEFNIGQLLYFYEKACALSAYSLNVNPFNQPGVEAYKKNMFRLLKT